MLTLVSVLVHMEGITALCTVSVVYDKNDNAWAAKHSEDYGRKVLRLVYELNCSGSTSVGRGAHASFHS